MITITSSAIIGLDAVPVHVEADVAQGLPNFIIVGLPDAAVQESRERVRAALRNCGYPFPRTRLTVNLAPADIRKEGPAYDLPIAVAILVAGGVLPPDAGKRRVFIGELALDGSVRMVSGALPCSLMAADRGATEVYVPVGNADEAALADGTRVYGVRHITELVAHLCGTSDIAPTPTPEWNNAAGDSCAAMPRTAVEKSASVELAPGDLAHIRGQAYAKRALEIAAAGGHNILLSGPPGAGKTMLARALPSILPPMSREETLEVTRIASVAGILNRTGLVRERPLRAPHHTASGAAMIGGGSMPRPGEVSLAHRGVLLLDEFPEFSRMVLENLRQPLEEGFVTVSRAHGTVRFPARFMLVAARNPCPCGYATDPTHACSCPAAKVAAYGRKLSGPLMDRIDLHVEVPRIPTEELFVDAAAEPSSAVRARVCAARELQGIRLKPHGLLTNGDMPSALVRRTCALDAAPAKMLRAATDRLNLSARAVTRVLRVARTIADLDGAERIGEAHVLEAVQYRERR